MSSIKTELTTQSIEADVTQRWNRILELEDKPHSDDFFELGGTSLKALQLLTEIEENLGLKVPLMSFAQRPTLSGLVDWLRMPAKARSTSIVPMQPNGSKVPFFFVHAEFGHVLFAQQLAVALSPDQSMYGLQSRGLNGGEEPLTTMHEMAAHYVREMKSIQAQGPYRLGGFCMGALLALEMTNQLQDAGEVVSHLAIFSTDASWMNIDGIRDQLEFHRREMGKGGPSGALRYLLARTRFRLHRLYSSGVMLLHRLYASRDKALPAKLRYVYIAELNYRAGWDFHPRPYHGTISYFQGEDDQRRDPRPFWGNLADGGIEIHSVTGELSSIFGPPHVDRLASAFGASLERPAAARAPPRGNGVG